MERQIKSERLLRRAKKLFEEGEYDAAEAALEQYKEHNDSYPDVFFMLGVINHSRGDVDRAIEYLERAVEIHPEYMEANLNLSIACNDRGLYDRGQKALERYLAAAGEDRTGQHPLVLAKLANKHMELADLYMKIQNYDPAIAEYKRAIAICPRFTDIQCKLGVAYREAGRLEESIESLRTAIELNSNYLKARINLGLTYYKKGMLPEAREMWEAVLEDSPDHPQVRLLLTNLAAENNHKTYRKTIQLDGR